MELVRAEQLEPVKRQYIDVIENTPGMQQHARWEYGKHPSDELLKAYIGKGEMYLLMDEGNIAGMTVVSMCQGEDYEAVKWQEDLRNDQVAALHLLTVCPAYRGRSLGLKLLEKAMAVVVKNGKKALRLDTLKLNLPARKMYERAGFSYRGEQRLYVESLGTADFVYYEKIPGGCDGH